MAVATVEIVPVRSDPVLTITLRTLPPSEPPFDDELHPGPWPATHPLLIDWPVHPPHELPGSAASTESGDGPARRLPHPGIFTNRPVVAGASPDAKLAVRRFIHMAVEVLNGFRPPAHLRRLTRPADAARVVTAGTIGAQRMADLRKRLHSPSRRHARRPPPVAVIGLRICEPRPGAVEAAATLLTADRTWAMALRLEHHQQSWSATTMRLLH